MRSLFLISNSTQHERGYLDHCETALREFLTGVGRLVFLPFALADHDDYADVVIERLGRMGIRTESLHRSAVPSETIDAADAIFIGGGNSFRLLQTLYEKNLIGVIQNAVKSGTRYVGSSAGTNMACPTIRTTNDMPIVEPPSLRALALVPFQINPHYLDADPDSSHMGETRETRLREYLEENAGPVLALREGCWLHVRGDTAQLGGERAARLFRRDTEAKDISAGEHLDYLFSDSSE